MMTEYSYKYYDPLEQMMPARHQYISQMIKKNENLDLNEYLNNKTILDLGCGTGSFLSNYEDIAKNCTGVDTLDFFFKEQSSRLKLIKNNLESFLIKNKKRYDVIFLFEVIEHLDQRVKINLFKLIKKSLNKNGYIFFSTLNNNQISKFLSINIAENIFKLLPKKTHDSKLFISPNEIQKLCLKNSLKIIDISGLIYNPIIKTFSISKFSLVNYIGAIKN